MVHDKSIKKKKIVEIKEKKKECKNPKKKMKKNNRMDIVNDCRCNQPIYKI